MSGLTRFLILSTIVLLPVAAIMWMVQDFARRKRRGE